MTAGSLKRLVERGATLIAVGGATAIRRTLELPVADALLEPRAGEAGVPPASRGVFIPGSILRARVDNSTPLAYGFESEVDVFFDQSPVFHLDGTGASGPRSVAWFSEPAPLRSGWAIGQDRLTGAVAVADVPLGRGRVLLLGPEVTFRAQAHGTFKFLFNGVYYGAAAPARP
jgi:hypothetical protein